MRIAGKISMVAVVPLIGIAATIGLGLYDINAVDRASRSVMEDRFQPLFETELPELMHHLRDGMGLVQHLNQNADAVVLAEKQSLSSKGDALQIQVDAHASHLAAFNEEMEHLEEEHLASPEIKTAFEKLKLVAEGAEGDGWVAKTTSAIGKAAQGGIQINFARKISNGSAATAFVELTAAINELETAYQGYADARLADFQKTYLAGKKALQGSAETVAQAQTVLVIIGLVALVLSGIIALSIARPILTNLKRLRKISNNLANGRLAEESHIKASDELGDLSHDMDQAMVGIRSAIGESEVDWQELGAKRDQAEQLTKNMAGILKSITGNLEVLENATQDMKSSATTLSGTAEETSNQAGNVEQSAGAATQSVDSVAAASEELSASIGDIARNTNVALEHANHARNQSETAGELMTRLAESSKSISQVVDFINDIAEQTNLLALNATIEAARAGEAGKGFAVVAGEVKELARQTGQATEDIQKSVVGIQNDSTAAVEAIQGIVTLVSQIHEGQTSIAAAVEEQAVTVNEVSRGASQAAEYSRNIGSNIQEVADAARNTSEVASNALATAERLGELSEELKAVAQQGSSAD